MYGVFYVFTFTYRLNPSAPKAGDMVVMIEKNVT